MINRSAMPLLSSDAQSLWLAYDRYLSEEVDLRPATIRNYLSDVRQFMAWCEARWMEGVDVERSFSLKTVATPTITAYRDDLRGSLHCKPATINRYLVSLKRFFTWAVATQVINHNPAAPVKRVNSIEAPIRRITDVEEANLVAAAKNYGSLRDQTIIILMLHTGLRAGEVCSLTRQSIDLGKRSGLVKVWGKRSKYREVPLNITVRQALETYLASLPPQQEMLFESQRTQDHLTRRGLGFIIAKYARQGGLKSLRPHDLRHRFGYRMAEKVPLHRLAQIMGHDSLDTTMTYIRGTPQDLQQAVESIAWE